MSVTAVLLNWKRPWNLPRIVDLFASVPEINQVIVYDNSGLLGEHAPPVTLRVGVELCIRNALSNACTYGRFLSSIHTADNDWIYTQDDDILVNNIPEIIAHRESHPNHITAALTDGHFKHEAGKAEHLQLGWGSIFRRGWIKPAFQPWLDTYGENELLHRKADRIFTMMIGKERHNPILADVERLKDPDGKFSDCSEDALWKQPDHFRLTQQAAECVRKLKASHA